jgi:hypothetical protein
VIAIAWLVACAQLSLGQTIAKVPELAEDRWNFDSTLWEKATAIGDFKVVGDGSGAAAAPAAQKTEVRVAHDGVNLYLRYTMFDDAIGQLKAAELDEFGDEFPQGDHGELWVTQGGLQLFAFDPNGNKYDAHNYDKRFFSGFSVKSRKGDDQWQSIMVIPLKTLFRGPVGKSLPLAFVRHLDRGAKDAERSTATGQPPTVRINYALE